jgi:outer membrane immunogenic protein
MLRRILCGASLMLAAMPAYAQEAEPGFNGIYVGVAGGYDGQSNDRRSRILFDRNLDGRFGARAR